MKSKLCPLLCALIAVWSIAQLHHTAANKCSSARTCSECIAEPHHCHWCGDEGFQGSTRCSSSSDPNCKSSESIVSSYRILQNKQFDKKVQLKPQKFNVELRAGDSVELGVSFKRADDYPLDLYYLMDMSCTMLPHKDSVSQIGTKLRDIIRKTTRDFRMGFGSFVDKETVPFTAYRPMTLGRYSCEQKGKLLPIPVDTYGFKHHMSLSNNSKQFEQEVDATQTSANLDFPEGTLDALMQVMVCKGDIGWRSHSDKIIVVATDIDFHFAGDGKLGGIMLPNDGKCHLDKSGRYYGTNIYDYPSMHHIAHIAKSKKFNIIFSVKKKVESDYRTLIDLIGPNAHRTNLIEDYGQITDIIREIYANITTSVELVVERKPPNVKVKIEVLSTELCEEKFKEVSSCKFKGKSEIKFRLHIGLTSCRKVGTDSKSTIVVGVSNMDEKIVINLRELCACPCEQNGESYSYRCSGNGNFSCGICTSCNSGFTGKVCQCEAGQAFDPGQPNSNCKTNEGLICSGHGKCCGKCECDPKWTGDLCDQDQSACFGTTGQKCNNRGKCIGTDGSFICQCEKGYTGAHCECPDSTEECKDVNGTICSGRGECLCVGTSRKCVCNKQATARGAKCEQCYQCEDSLYCDRILACLSEKENNMCLNANIKPDKESVRDKLPENLCSITREKCNTEWYKKSRFVPVNKREELDNGLLDDGFSNENSFAYPCLKVVNGCDVSFSYRFFYADEEVRVKRLIKIEPLQATCPVPVNLAKAAGAAFGAVLLLGLAAIILWKVFTEYYDRREYQKFVFEVDNAEFSEMINPLYRDVKLRYRNPARSMLNRASRYITGMWNKRSSTMEGVRMSQLNKH